MAISVFKIDRHLFNKRRRRAGQVTWFALPPLVAAVCAAALSTGCSSPTAPAIVTVNLTGRWKNTSCAGCTGMEFTQSGRNVVGRQIRSFEPEPLRPDTNLTLQIADQFSGEITGPDPGTTLTGTETETETVTDGVVTMSCTYVWNHVYQISGNDGTAGQGQLDGTINFPGITLEPIS